ncbi:MAG: ABC transporter substrate-binding protein, partial [Proteobacteria bacterium]|nr:ABC transporter substrate-binding protein [Pseudomonadota bacterium]
MTKKTKAQLDAGKTVDAARGFTRRTILKGAAGGVALAAGPFVSGRQALSSSGELDILMWS